MLAAAGIRGGTDSRFCDFRIVYTGYADARVVKVFELVK